MKLIGLTGSLRKASYNTALLNAAAGLVPDGVTLQVETLHGIPLYNGDDEEATGIPPRVAELKDAIAAADGVVISTPEYNGAMAGVFKNAHDWMTRPPKDIGRVWGGKKVAIMGASPSGFGTVSAQTSWLPVFRNIGAQPWMGAKLHVSQAYNVFDDDGALTDETVRDNVEKYLKGFVDYVKG